MEIPFKVRTVFRTTLPILFEGLTIFTIAGFLIAEQYSVNSKALLDGAEFRVAIFITLVCQAALHIGGHYNPLPMARVPALFIGLSKVYSIAFVTVMAMLLLTKGSIDPLVILGGFGLMLTISLSWRLFWAKVTEIRLFRQKVILLGTRPSACRIMQVVTNGDSADPGAQNTGQLEILPVDDCEKLIAAADACQARHVVVCRSMAQQLTPEQLCSYKHHGLSISDETSLMEGVCGWIDPVRLDPKAVIFSRSFRRSSRRFCKRTGDILIAALLLIFLAPLAVAVSIPIKICRSGFALAKDPCVGVGHKTFTRYSFRTSDSPPDHSTHLKGIQALPQLWNVLKGDMSLVGPAPIGPDKAADISRELPLFGERFTVRPGLTGWAQINCDCDVSTSQGVQQMFGYDLFYLKHLSLLMDVVITARAIQFQALGSQNTDNAS